MAPILPEPLRNGPNSENCVVFTFVLLGHSNNSSTGGTLLLCVVSVESPLLTCVIYDGFLLVLFSHNVGVSVVPVLVIRKLTFTA